MSDTSSGAIESSLQEGRLFAPPAEFAKSAHVKSLDEYRRLYRESIDNPQNFWGGLAEKLHWFKKWDKVLDWNVPNARWFVGGKLNAAYNCLDAQIEAGRGGKTAILWEGEPEAGGPHSGGEIRHISFSQLKDQVCQLSNALKSLGVKKGDRVTIYMPMVPEAAVAMLACARIGAAFGHLRRIQQPGDCRPGRGCTKRHHHHGRRGLSARQRGAAESQCR